jgi:hypothetical protein
MGIRGFGGRSEDIKATIDEIKDIKNPVRLLIQGFTSTKGRRS